MANINLLFNQLSMAESSLADFRTRLDSAISANRPAAEIQNLREEVSFFSGKVSELNAQIDAARKTLSADQSRARAQTAGDAVSNQTAQPTAVSQNTGTDTDSAISTPLTASETANVRADGQTSADTDLLISQSAAEMSDADRVWLSPVVASLPQLPVTPEPNPLNQYATYTYGLSLHVLSPDEYRKINNLRTGMDFKPATTLISSAMRYKDSRDENFTDDFYFDNFNINSIIGLTQAGQGGNNVQASFTLIEPYGLTLLNRILEVSTYKFDVPNFKQLPYLVEINFFGADDSGVYRKLDEHTKFFPLMLVNFEITAGVRGSEYKISGVPYSHYGNLQSIQAVKANFEVQASTVGEFFSNKSAPEVTGEIERALDKQRILQDQNQLIEQSNQDLRRRQDQERKRIEEQLGKETADAIIREEIDGESGSVFSEQTQNINSIEPATIRTYSFTGAYNLWNQILVKTVKSGIADLIAFEIDPEIAKAQIVDPQTQAPSQTSGNGDNSNPAANTGNDPETQKTTASSALNKNSGIFNVNAGTTVSSLIKRIVINSTYILDQLTDLDSDRPSSGASANPDVDITSIGSAQNLAAEAQRRNRTGPVKWFKILPKVELLDFDMARGVFGRKITYVIKSYDYINAQDPRMAKSQPAGAVKEYNYIYTGQNRDVIDFDIDFSTLYFTAIPANTLRGEVLNPAKITDPRQSGTPSSPIDSAYGPQAQQVNYVPATQGSLVGQAATDSRRQQAQGVADSIYTKSAGDMINLKLKILGDPEFIKQDEIFYPPSSQKTRGQYVGNSINMDSGQIFCRVNFMTPVDMDETTGLLRNSEKYVRSYFSGFYSVISVESDFRRGQFVQTLNLIRHPNQPGDQLKTPTQQSVGADSERGVRTSTGQSGFDLIHSLTNFSSVTQELSNGTVIVQNPDGTVSTVRSSGGNDEDLFNPVNQFASTTTAADGSTVTRIDVTGIQRAARNQAIQDSLASGASIAEAEAAGQVAGNTAGSQALARINLN